MLFERFFGGFRIKFLSSESVVKNTPLQAKEKDVPLNVPLNEKIFELINGASGIQRKDLAAKLDFAEKTIGRALSILISEGKIERRGSKKTGGYWAL